MCDQEKDDFRMHPQGCMCEPCVGLKKEESQVVVLSKQLVVKPTRGLLPLYNGYEFKPLKFAGFSRHTHKRHLPKASQPGAYERIMEAHMIKMTLRQKQTKPKLAIRNGPKPQKGKGKKGANKNQSPGRRIDDRSKNVTGDISKGVQNVNLGPVMAGLGGGSLLGTIAGLVVEHRELIGDVINGLNEYVIQPGAKKIFEWLSRQAKDYTQYSVDEFSTEFVPAVSTVDQGTCTMAFDYDPSEEDLSVLSPEELRKHISSFVGSVETPVWQPSMMHTDKDSIMSAGSKKLVRTGPVADNNRLYDMGRLIVNVADFEEPLDPTPEPDDAVGRLYARYKIRLSIPRTDERVEDGKTTILGLATGATFITSITHTAQPLSPTVDDWDVAINPFELGTQVITPEAMSGYVPSAFVELPTGQWKLSFRGGSLSLDGTPPNAQFTTNYFFKMPIVTTDGRIVQELTSYIVRGGPIPSINATPNPSPLSNLTQEFESTIYFTNTEEDVHIGFYGFVNGFAHNNIGPPFWVPVTNQAVSFGNSGATLVTPLIITLELA
jgi:hypothetical protein